MGKSYVTKNKALIMEFLKEHKDYGFFVSDVYKYLIDKNLNINLATVYRNLDKLTEEGVLIKYRTAQDDSFMYQFVDLQKSCKDHLHMQCSECGKIIHLECDFMKEVTMHLLEHHGFEVRCESTILKGVCKECKSALNN